MPKILGTTVYIDVHRKGDCYWQATRDSVVFDGDTSMEAVRRALESVGIESWDRIVIVKHKRRAND